MKNSNKNYKLLKEIVKRVSPNIRVEDAFSRIGGDEFILLFTNIVKEKSTIWVDKAVSLFEKPWAIDGIKLNVTTSIGVSIFLDDEITKLDL